MTEPRRVAAVCMSRRVAEEMNLSSRFDYRVSNVKSSKCFVLSQSSKPYMQCMTHQTDNQLFTYVFNLCLSLLCYFAKFSFFLSEIFNSRCCLTLCPIMRKREVVLFVFEELFWLLPVTDD